MSLRIIRLNNDLFLLVGSLILLCCQSAMSFRTSSINNDLFLLVGGEEDALLRGDPAAAAAPRGPPPQVHKQQWTRSGTNT